MLLQRSAIWYRAEQPSEFEGAVAQAFMRVFEAQQMHVFVEIERPEAEPNESIFMVGNLVRNEG